MRQFYGFFTELVLLHQRTHALDDLGRAFVARANVVDDLSQVLSRRTSIEQHPRRFRVAKDCAQRLMKLVCERRCQLTQGGTTIEVRHRRQVAARLDFGTSPPSILEE
jgi:hypothetical protein